MTLYIDSEVMDPNDGRITVKHGKLHFVDLAGIKLYQQADVFSLVIIVTIDIKLFISFF